MAWIGAIVGAIGTGAGIGQGNKSGRRGAFYQRIADNDARLVNQYAKEQADWAQQDWDRFKTEFGPLEESMLARAEKGIDPDLEGVTGKAGTDSALTFGAAQDKLTGALNTRGINPASGRAAGARAEIGMQEADNRGLGINRARTKETNRADDATWAQRVQMTSLGRGISTDASAASGRASAAAAAGAASNQRIASGYQARSNAGYAAAGKAIGGINWGKIFGGGGKTGYDWGGNTDAQAEFNSQNAEFGGDYSGPTFRRGGLVRGPGTGKSDSVPAVVDGRSPARVSNGEYRIPGSVAQKIGIDFLNKISGVT